MRVYIYIYIYIYIMPTYTIHRPLYPMLDPYHSILPQFVIIYIMPTYTNHCHFNTNHLIHFMPKSHQIHDHIYMYVQPLMYNSYQDHAKLTIHHI